ncbi:DUF1307 domain-containing protein [Staphylococcus hominis]|uniref:DUF1307 domain-containing protein n=1 Tax=Staphylococcus hominis TaxID=1290 RepID=UPI001F5852A4|nr:DUF1307 domain-containing protein [Staphylococcus hominis]MCI2890515.1 DUF1307 domain-containing protein [Staphylococcus hominis]
MSMMKKVLTLFVLLVLSVSILGACTQSRSKTYEGDIEGKHVLTTLTYKNNKVIKQSIVSTLKYEDLRMSKQEGKKSFKDHRPLKGKKGVTYTLSSKHQKIVENIDIDYNKANLKDVSRYFALAHYSKNYKKVTMDGTVKELKKIGFKKKSNMNEE